MTKRPRIETIRGRFLVRAGSRGRVTRRALGERGGPQPAANEFAAMTSGCRPAPFLLRRDRWRLADCDARLIPRPVNAYRCLAGIYPSLAPKNCMRVAVVFVLLLAASARPALAQHVHLPPAHATLPGSLTPSGASDASDPLVLDLRRNHAQGAVLGLVVGGVAGALVGNFIVCTSSGGEGDARSICKGAGIGYGALVGAIVGGIIGLPDRPAR